MSSGPIKLAFIVLAVVSLFMAILSIQYLDNVAEEMLFGLWIGVCITCAYYYMKKEPEPSDMDRHLARRRYLRNRARRRRG